MGLMKCDGQVKQEVVLSFGPAVYTPELDLFFSDPRGLKSMGFREENKDGNICSYELRHK